MNARENQVRKGLADLTSELLLSLQVVRDACNGLRSGQRHHALALSGQLRGLLLDRAKGSLRLLPEVTEILGLKPTLFVMDGVDHPLPLSAEPVFHIAGPPFTLFRQLPSQKEVPLTDLKEHPLVSFDGQQYSVGEIVEYLANKSGGAHFAKSLPEGLARLFAAEIPDLMRLRDAVLNALMQIGEAIYKVGLESVRQLTDLHLVIDLALPQPVGGMVIYDALYDGKRMRITIMMSNDKHLCVRLLGLDGAVLTTRVEPHIDWSESHVLYLRVSHDDHLQTVVHLEIDDGSVNAQSVSVEPVFCTNRLEQYDARLNAAADGDAGDWSLVLGQFIVLGYTTPLNLAQVRVKFANDTKANDRRVAHFLPGSYGSAPPGERNIAMTGVVRHVALPDALNGAVGESGKSD